MVTTHGSGGARPPEPEFLNVARVLRPWGVRGELKLELLGSRAQDILDAKRVYLGDDRRPLQVERARLHGVVAIVKLAGYDTPEQADLLRGESLSIALSDAPPLKPNQYYQFQILGLAAVTVEGEMLGTVVEIIETGAHDVYVVTGPHGEILIPARREFVVRIDLPSRRMTVSLLPGMLPEER